MFDQHASDALLARSRLEGPRLEAAMLAASFQARRLARGLSLPEADRDDLQQSILMAVLTRAGRYDESRALWSTFVGLVARHAAADLAQSYCSQPNIRPLDEAEHGLADPSTPDPDLRIDIRHALMCLPLPLRHLVELVARTGSLADAQRATAMPTASFYRQVRDLRMRLLAAGLASPREKNARASR